VKRISLNDQLDLHPLRARDAPVHFALMRRIYPPAFAYLWPDGGVGYVERIHGEPSFLRDLSEEDAPYYRVEWEGKPIGVLRLQLHHPCPDVPGASALKLDRLYLGPEARGKGVGTSLLQYTFDLATQLGKQLVWLERMDSNEDTIAFYQRRGFREGGTFRYGGPDMLEEFRGMRRLLFRLT
jgi:GNAT superfamily N-acetyltransferase